MHTVCMYIVNPYTRSGSQMHIYNWPHALWLGEANEILAACPRLNQLLLSQAVPSIYDLSTESLRFDIVQCTWMVVCIHRIAKTHSVYTCTSLKPPPLITPTCATCMSMCVCRARNSPHPALLANYHLTI